MTSRLHPIHLLADSELLFRPDASGRTLPAVIRDHLAAKTASAAYIGASNGDDPAFYELFAGAMDTGGITRIAMIPSAPTETDLARLREADVILLAGGDVRRGWGVIDTTGMRETLIERHRAGAALIGVSAGAVQLGRFGYDDDGTFDTIGLVPFIVGAHDEAAGWGRLRRIIGATAGGRGIGIPHGAGLVVGPENSLEPLRRSSIELARGVDGVVTERMLDSSSRYA